MHRAPTRTSSLVLWVLRVLWVLSLMLTCLIPAAISAQRSDFPATYRITDVSEEENQVELTLSLTVHNYSGGEIRNCGIVLKQSDPLSTPIGTFDLIEVFPSYQDITVSHAFTVPRSEYARWERGAEPRLDILLPDGSEGATVESIDARRESLPAETAK